MCKDGGWCTAVQIVKLAKGTFAILKIQIKTDLTWLDEGIIELSTETYKKLQYKQRYVSGS